MLTLAFAVAVCPLSSATLQVICIEPVDAPAEEYVAVAPVPLTVPPEAW